MAKEDRLQRELSQLKRLEERKAKVEAALKRKQATIAEQARKRRVKLFYQVGALADLAGIAEEDRGFLLGGFLALAGKREDKDEFQRLKRKGDEALKDKERQKRDSK